MRKLAFEFFRRGLTACGLGPIVLAVLYLILHRQGLIETLTVREVCVGIFSLTALAFLAGGINVIYQIERLNLMTAVLIHGLVLYGAYLGTYLVNDWLEWGRGPILAFTVIFAVGYLIIWAVISVIIHRRTRELNEKLRKQRERSK